MSALTLALGVATAHASLFSPVSSFGSAGSGAGQFSSPLGVSVGPSNEGDSGGAVYVADPGNVRVDKFDAHGHFLAAFGWGVADGQARSEVCTSTCQAGIPGSGAGQFSNPTSVAADSSGNEQGDQQGGAGPVYVGDAGNNVVEKFTSNGRFLATIDGTTTPQGHFQCLAGVSVDQDGSLWTADACTNNIDEFDVNGAFVRQWTDTRGGPSSIAVDSDNGAVYLRDASNDFVERYTLNGTWKGVVDEPSFLAAGRGFASALSLDPASGNLYVDHTPGQSGIADVAVYDRNGTKIDDLTLPSGSNSNGLAVSPSENGSGRLYLSDASANNVTIYAPQSTPGAPLVTFESAKQTGTTTATLNAGIVPLGHDTSCTFQYVDNATFQTTGYSNATSVPCTPADLGSGFSYQTARARVSGLATGTFYHFRVVATSSAGTTTGADQEFQAGPGAWAPFNRCNVDDPSMLATDGGTTTLALCIASNSTHGSITLGNITTATAGTNLQFASVLNENTSVFSVIPPAGGALAADPVQLNTPVGPVTAVTTSAGTPSNFNLFAGIEVGVPIITLPIKIQLANNPTLGPSCFIGSDQNPIVLHPQNNDVSNAVSVGGFFTFDPNGAVDPAGPLTSLVITGSVQGDDTFAVPGATGCGPNGDGSLDAAVNAVAGIPSPSGSNHLVLDDASSALAAAFGAGGGISGQQFAADWHSAFG